MKYAISINEGRQTVGPYGTKESAERRAAWILRVHGKKVTDATVVEMKTDSEAFGKPIGNLTNH